MDAETRDRMIFDIFKDDLRALYAQAEAARIEAEAALEKLRNWRPDREEK